MRRDSGIAEGGTTCGILLGVGRGGQSGKTKVPKARGRIMGRLPHHCRELGANNPCQIHQLIVVRSDKGLNSFSILFVDALFNFFNLLKERPKRGRMLRKNRV